MILYCHADIYVDYIQFSSVCMIYTGKCFNLSCLHELLSLILVLT